MKKRDIFLPSLSTLLIFGLVVFLSCAHQNRVQDEFGNEVEENQEQVSENTEGTESVEQVEGEVAQTEEQVQEAEQKGEQAVDELSQGAEQKTEEIAQAVPAEGAQAATDELGIPTDAATAEAVPPTQPSEADQLLGTSPPPSDTMAATGSDPLAVPPTDTLAQTEPPADTVAPPPSTPTWDSPKSAPSTYSGVSAPVIPTSAVHKKGALLNRFYFARKGDTPGAVSELIYGNSGQAKNLRKWNAGTFGAGKLVYYASPSNPEDTQMKSFYQERNISPDEYTVERGDWLSKIAHAKLGSPKSWKEIAVINGMDSPDKLEVGQKIAIYPTDLKGAPQQEQPLAQMEQKEEPIAVAQPQAPAPIAPPTQVMPDGQVPPQGNLAPMDQAPTPQEPVAPVIEPPKKIAPKIKENTTTKLLEQNLFFIVIGAGILALLGALMLVNKRKKARADEFGEEGFPAPTKLKRK